MQGGATRERSLANPAAIFVGFILLLSGRASPTQWIVAVRVAPVCDEDEQLKGLELYVPRREAEVMNFTVVDSNVQPVASPVT